MQAADVASRCKFIRQHYKNVIPKTSNPDVGFWPGYCRNPIARNPTTLESDPVEIICTREDPIGRD